MAGTVYLTWYFEADSLGARPLGELRVSKVGFFRGVEGGSEAVQYYGTRKKGGHGGFEE